MTAPLLYVFGDDDLVAARAVDRFAETLTIEFGAPLERWDVRVEYVTSSDTVARLHERLATSPMFGAGTLVVVANPGALVRKNEDRDTTLAAIRALAPGNAMAVVEAAKANAKGPGIKRLWDAMKGAGANAVAAESPRLSSLSAWIRAEARQRGIAMEPTAAQALAERLGSRVTEKDVDRRYLSRLASMELDKLALRHAIDDGPVTADDVDALVAETTPSSVWRLTDAVSERRGEEALEALDRLQASTPEPVLLAALHRRVRELLEVGDRTTAGESPRDIIAATGLHPFVVEKHQRNVDRWTPAELTRALHGLLELDAMVKNVPGSAADPAQRRLAFALWVRRYATRRQMAGAGSVERSVGPG